MFPRPHSSMVSGVLGSRLAWGRGDTGGTGDWRVSGRTGSVGGAQEGDPEEGIWEGDM